MFEQMEEHHPTYDHWYLPLIGVEPVAQGRRLGSALLQHALETCDSDGLPAYLEATSPRNRNLYARHGFGDVATIQAGSSPPLWAMLREPAPRSPTKEARGPSPTGRAREILRGRCRRRTWRSSRERSRRSTSMTSTHTSPVVRKTSRCGHHSPPSAGSTRGPEPSHPALRTPRYGGEWCPHLDVFRTTGEVCVDVTLVERRDRSLTTSTFSCDIARAVSRERGPWGPRLRAALVGYRGAGSRSIAQSGGELPAWIVATSPNPWRA